MKFPSTHTLSKRHFGITLCLLIAGLIAWGTVDWRRAHGQGGNIVTTVSAASFEAAPVAPEAIVAAFGTSLATRIESATTTPLPTSLAGTSVKVKDSSGAERLASLFFVSPTQVNCLVPKETRVGAATITITSGDNQISTGAVQIASVAPSLFTANASGQGVAAAVVLRVKADGSQVTEAVSRFDQTQNRFVPIPIDLGPESEQVFLILFGGGIRGRSDLASVTTKVGGIDAETIYAGPAPGFAGLDQSNVRLPRSLAGRGRVNLILSIAGGGASNPVELEIAASPGAAPPQVSGISPAAVLAGQSLTIDGQGFAASAADNLVRIGGVEARVTAASPTQLTVRVPFGAESGPISIRTQRGEWISASPLTLRTSVSGIVEDTRRQPLAGVAVRLRGTSINATSNSDGSFILPDTPPGLAQVVEIDGGNIPGSLPFPKILLKVRVLPNRDNQITGPIALQQINGPAIQVGGGSFAPEVKSSALRLTAWPAPQTPNQTGRIGNVVFEIQPGTTVIFPNGSTSGTLNLTIVENSRTPVSLPPNIFSTVIAQITAIGATLNPGGKLTFPNTDRLPAGSQATLYRFDQRPNSPTLGSFIESGAVTVSADGQRIESSLGAVTETTLYFVAAPRLATTVVGRVVDSDGATPVRQARVRARGQEAFTDGNGGFILRNVLVNAGDQLSVEASFMRPDLRVDRTQRTGLPAVVSGVTQVADLVLPSENSNRPPVVLIPTSLNITEGEPRNLNFVAGDPDAGQRVVDVRISGASFVSITKGSDDTYTLQLTPRINDAGAYTLILTATDNLGASLTFEIALRVNRPPAAIAQTVTLDEDTTKPITLAGADPTGLPLSFILVSRPVNGSLSGTAPNLVYTPRRDFNGSDSFTFRVNNGTSDSAPAQVSIFVNPINDAPALNVPGSQIVDEGRNVSFVITASDVDVGDVQIFSATNLPGGAMLRQLNARSAQFDWTPSFLQVGSYTITFVVRDNGVPVLSDTKTVTVGVVGQWSRTAGPEGGGVSTVLVNGTNLFAGAFSGAFLSTNNGENWTSVNNGLARCVNSFAAIGARVFAGTCSGVYVSTSNGASWSASNRGMGQIRVNVLILSGPNLFAGTTAGVFVSTDNGGNWMAINNGLPQNLSIRSLIVSGANLFAGTQGDGVFISTNNGQNWVAMSNGLPQGATILSFAVSGANLFAGTESNGVYTSTTNGASWTAASVGLPTLQSGYFPVNALAVNGTTLFAGIDNGRGIYRSTDNGVNWTRTNNGLPEWVFAYFLTVSGTDIYAGTLDGIFRSTDNGQNWVEINNGLGKYINTFSVSGGNLVASGTSVPAIYVSSNNGASWSRRNNSPIYATSFTVSGTNLFAGTRYDGVYRSIDNGQSWEPANSGLPQGAYVLSLTASGANLFAGTDANGVYVSTNGGQNWMPASNGLPQNAAINALTVRSVTEIVAGTNGSGIFASNNGGATWTALNEGLTNTVVRSFVGTGPALLVGTDGGIFSLSPIPGSNWRAVSNSPKGVRSFAGRGNYIFASNGLLGGVFVSTDNGQSWETVNAGIRDQSVLALAVGGNNLFAGTDNGVWVTRF